MPNQFLSPEGDLENYFVTESWLIDQYVGDQLWTWGSNGSGQLGDNTLITRLTPVTTFAGGTNWKQVSGGLTHTAAIKTDGTLWTWGLNTYGQLGDNTATNRSTPVTTFAGGTDWKQVACAYRHIAAIKTDGTLWTWGINSNGSLGDLGDISSTNRSTPVTTFAGGTNWKQVSVASNFTAAIKTDGTLWTWGANGYGQLGRSTFILTPVTTFAGGTNWKQVAGGGNFTAAIKTDGTLWTWGQNTGTQASGQLGTNDVNTRITPVTTFAGGTDWSQVSCGQYHIAAIKTDGTLWTWGFNSTAQLGDNTATNRCTPVTTFTGGTNWSKVACGLTHTAAIKTDGTLWIWGSNQFGRLGTNDTNNRYTPVTTFAGGTDWSKVAGGQQHTAAIKTDGTLWTWGNGGSSQLGNNTSTDRLTPVTTFTGGTNWSKVDCGYRHTAAIKTDGTLWTWGLNTSGQLGDNTIITNSTPVTTFTGGTNWSQVAGGNGHTAAIKTDGTLWTWGSNTRGQLGDNTTTNRSTPVTTFTGGTLWSQLASGPSSSHMMAITDDGTNKILYGFGDPIALGINDLPNYRPDQVSGGGTTWKQVACSGGRLGGSTAAIKTDGTLWTWGSNGSGQLGDNTLINRSTPVTTFAGGTNWKQVAGGGNFTAAIKTNGTLWTWGNIGFGQLGRLIIKPTPVTTFAGGTNWSQVVCGVNFTAAIKTDGTLWTWGINSNGQLGDNTLINRSTPVTTFAGGTDWSQVAGGSSHTMAIKTDGTLWTWGLNTSGQLGDNTIITRSTPVTTFAGGTNWSKVAGGNGNTAAIKTDGTLWTWGANGSGSLGDNTTTNRPTPVTTFAGGTDWSQVSPGGTAAIKTDGTLWTWGFNGGGSLGDNTLITRLTPVTTFAGGTTWSQVVSGQSNTVAIKTDGTLWTWGGNTGDNTTITRSTPVTTFAGGTNWSKVAGGASYTAAIKTNGTLWTWGNNGNGQLGTNDINIRITPVTTFAGGTLWSQVASGPLSTHTMAITDDGTNKILYGFGTIAGLGINDAPNYYPGEVYGGGTTWKQVACDYHSISLFNVAAIKTDGTLWTWGANVGDNTGSPKVTPVTTFAGGTNWKQVSCGGNFTLAVTSGTDPTFFVS